MGADGCCSHDNSSAKAGKIEVLQQRRLAAEAKAQYNTAVALFITQAAKFLVQVPVNVATKDLKRGSSLLFLWMTFHLNLILTNRMAITSLQ